MKKIIVFGSFDPLHQGHLNFFNQAKKLGDYLIVVVARDENIKKNKNREVRFGEDERMKAVEATQIANEVMLGDESDSYTILEKINPDVIAVGYDQKIPEVLKNKVKKYKIVTLKPFKPEIFKSSKMINSDNGPIV